MEKIRVLLLSDIHMHQENINLLKKWHLAKNRGVNYDYVFISGDIAALPNNSDIIDQVLESQCEGHIQAMFMNDLEGFADELIYIPGNHDPSTLFNRDRSKLPIISSNVDANIHMGALKLRDGLVIVGLGGSVPDYV